MYPLLLSPCNWYLEAHCLHSRSNIEPSKLIALDQSSEFIIFPVKAIWGSAYLHVCDIYNIIAQANHFALENPNSVCLAYISKMLAHSYKHHIFLQLLQQCLTNICQKALSLIIVIKIISIIQPYLNKF